MDIARRAIAAAIGVILIAPATGGSVVQAHHTATGGIQIVRSSGFDLDSHPTNNPLVTVKIPPPANAASQIRLSNDNATWVERPYAASVAWSVTDPAAGGTAEDGTKHVYVEYGDGTTWAPAGTDNVSLDRVAPVWTNFALADGATSIASWRVGHGGQPEDASSIFGTRHSLDGVRWSPWDPDRLDLRTIDYGGSWALGTRTMHVQVRDGAGNLSQVYSDSINVTQPPLTPDEGTVPVRFEFPRRAVTGELFTVRPLYPSGFTMPSNAWCEWSIHWGDDESLYGPPNENYGKLDFERAASAGGCREWTFTLPGVPVPRFDMQFQLKTKTADQGWNEGKTLYANQSWKQLAFSAAVGSTDRHIRSSSIPLVYLLPDSTLTQTGDPVTYRLYASGGLTVPQTGTFSTYPIECYINPHWSQQGGSSYTYTPTCNGNWVTQWAGTYKGGFMRVIYDPIADGTPPTVSPPVVRLDKAAMGTSAPITVSWSGRDAASSMYGYQLQRSLNGGSWTAVTLPSRLSTTVKATLPLSGSTRYRVRGRDAVGNWSTWKYGLTLRGYAYQETYQYLRWSGTWSTHTSSAWSGGAARRSTAAGATATFNFNTRSVAWVARKGPTNGLVRIWVDGAYAGTVDLRSSTVGARAVQFAKTWSAYGSHTLKIQNLGTVGSPGADLDLILLVK